MADTRALNFLPMRRAGVSSELINELLATGALAEDQVDAAVKSFTPHARIALASEESRDESRLVLRYGGTAFSEVIWHKD